MKEIDICDKQELLRSYRIFHAICPIPTVLFKFKGDKYNDDETYLVLGPDNLEALLADTKDDQQFGVMIEDEMFFIGLV